MKYLQEAVRTSNTENHVVRLVKLLMCPRKACKPTRSKTFIIINIIKTNNTTKLIKKDYFEKMLTNFNINNTKITGTPCTNVKLEDRKSFEKIDRLTLYYFPFC